MNQKKLAGVVLPRLRKRILLILMLCCMPCFLIPVSRVNGIDIYAWLGNYLRIDWIRTEWNIMVYKVNTTITLYVRLVNERDMFIKNIDFLIYNDGLIYNETLVANMSCPATGIPIVDKTIEFTPHEIGSLILHMFANYEYYDGNQTIQEDGRLDVYGIVVTVGNTLEDLQNRILELEYETHRLNSTIHDLNSSYTQSYATLERWTYFLAFTTIVSILALSIAVMFVDKNNNTCCNRVFNC